jgi:Bacterioferritin-associated ferredoxin
MYVCVCHGIRCRDVRAARGEGVCRPGEIFRQLDIRPQCGRCMATIREMLEGAPEEKAGPVSRRAHPTPPLRREG